MSPPSVVVVTSCTARKRHADMPLTLSGLDAAPTVAELARSWRARLAAVPGAHPVMQFYGGRAFNEALKAAAAASAALHVVSAGLGLVEGRTRVPAYDLTVSEKDGDLQVALRRLAASPAEWWRALSGSSGVARLVSDSPATFLLALPASYIEMLAEDLASITERNATRVRIFTSELGAQALPSHLRPAVMPYDDRLEAVPGWAGTRSDFAQRALCHFVAALKAHQLGREASRAAVDGALGGLQAPQRPVGARLDDAALRAWIHANWATCGGSTSRLLAQLRHGAGLACEQGRFAHLCREVRASLRGAIHGA